MGKRNLLLEDYYAYNISFVFDPTEIQYIQWIEQKCVLFIKGLKVKVE